MRYQGGKSRLAKYIVPILESHRRGRPFVEPFCGGCSITARMAGERYAYDANEALITMWRAVQAGWRPPEALSRDQYDALREACDRADPLTAFAAFGCSYRGAWFGGYASGRQPDPSRGLREFYPAARSAARSIAKKAPLLDGVRFKVASVFDLRPSNALVYCDPPYAGTRKYQGVPGFDHERFWQWCRDAAARGCMVFVSEYTAPDDATEVWSKTRQTTMSHTAGNRAPSTERLFRLG